MNKRHIVGVLSVFALLFTGCFKIGSSGTVQTTNGFEKLPNIRVPKGTFGEIRTASGIGLTESMKVDGALDKKIVQSEQFDAYLCPVPSNTTTQTMREWLNEYSQPLSEASESELLAFIKANPRIKGPIITSYPFTIKKGAHILLYAVRSNSMNIEKSPKWEIRGMQIPTPTKSVFFSRKFGNDVRWNLYGYTNRYYLAVGNRRFN